MRKYILGSLKFKDAVKMFLVSSLILAYFVYIGINSLCDAIFAMSFVILIFKYFLSN